MNTKVEVSIKVMVCILKSKLKKKEEEFNLWQTL